jgi:hypothetical protein
MKVRVNSNFVVDLSNVTSYGFVCFHDNIIFNFDDEELDIIELDGFCPYELHKTLNEKFMEAHLLDKPFFDAYTELLQDVLAKK